MIRPIEEEVLATSVLEVEALVCPVCLHHGIERLEGVTLTASTALGRPVSRALVYRCADWHIFAVFDRSTLPGTVTPAEL